MHLPLPRRSQNTVNNRGSFFYSCLVWYLCLIVDKMNTCLVQVHAWDEGKLCGNSVIYKIGFPPQKRFHCNSAFVSRINLNVGPNLTFSHFLNMYFSENVPLKLGEGGENKTKNPNQVWVCSRSHLRFSQFLLLVSLNLLISFPTCSQQIQPLQNTNNNLCQVTYLISRIVIYFHCYLSFFSISRHY